MDQIQQNNQKIQAEVNRLEMLEEETGRATWREYMRQITEEQAQAVRETLASEDLRANVEATFTQAGGSEGGMKYGESKFNAFMLELLKLFELPTPKNGESVWALLFRRYSSQSLEDVTQGQKKVLLLEDAQILVQTLSRVILKAFNLSELQSALSQLAKDIMKSDAWATELKSLEVRGVTGGQGLQEKKKKLLDENWKDVFGAADVGGSGLLSWETKQFHFFVTKVLEYFEFPKPEDETTLRRMFGTFAVEGVDVIDEQSCKMMVEGVIDAVVAGLS